jgi:hypothetical protein
MSTRITIALAAALVAGTATAAMARTPLHHPHHSAVYGHSQYQQAVPGYGFDTGSGTNAHAVRPFTQQEEELFDRASRSGPGA